jgi:hypothetical protein
MIDNVDQDEWTNSSVSLDRIVRRLEDQFVDDLFNFFIIYRITKNQDQLINVCCFVETDRPFSICIFKSIYQVMKSYFVINDQTLEVRLIRDH